MTKVKCPVCGEWGMVEDAGSEVECGNCHQVVRGVPMSSAARRWRSAAWVAGFWVAGLGMIVVAVWYIARG